MEEHSWLDKVIKEQAEYYGLKPEAHAKLMKDAATEQERIEAEGD